MTATVSSGLVAKQVLQRGKGDVATVKVAGTCSGDVAKVGVTITGTARGRGFGKPAGGGVVRNGRWTAKLSLPTGGPYDIQFRLGRETVRVSDVLVGDLWVMAGQSNMEGVGDLPAAGGRVESPHPLVHNFGMDEQWDVAVEPLHWLCESIDACHNAKAEEMARLIAAGLPAAAQRPWRAGRMKGAGCGLPFAKEMVKLTGVPVGLIACAHGGTSMLQWDPAQKGKGGASMYGSMLRRVRDCGGRASGLLWYQGESDALDTDTTAFVRQNKDLVAAARRDFGGPLMPWLFVQIGNYYNGECDFGGWSAIRQLQLDVEKAIPRSALVTAADLPLDDCIHVGTDGLRRLGRRLATVARRVVLGDRGVSLGPRPVRAVLEGANRDRIRVYFSGVNGELRAEGSPSGFDVLGPDGTVRKDLYRVRLQGASALLQLVRRVVPGTQVQYGRGKVPYCNITDGLDLGVPAFAPLTVEWPKKN
jgi:sialate O-acetylesterase